MEYNKHSKKNTKNTFIERIAFISILPVSLLFLELFARLFVGFGISKGLILTPIFVLGLGYLMGALICFLKPKSARITLSIALCFFAVFFSIHEVYYHIFRAFVSWQSVAMAGAITEFWTQTLLGIAVCSYQIIINFIPFILYMVWGYKLCKKPKALTSIQVRAIGLAVLLLIVSLLCRTLNRDNKIVYNNVKSDYAGCLSYYGFIGGGLKDFSGFLFGYPDEITINPYENNENTSSTSEPVEPDAPVYEDNVLNIDFDTLISKSSNKTIKDMHKYFSTVPATKQNEYTGMFKGKNLIFLTLEGFSDKVISPELTPTLYKMSNEGFKFTNFYDCVWGGSTATGEYSNMTGNFYVTANCLNMASNTYCYSSLGNMFKSAGYSTRAYHNHTYTYYGRNNSHPNFGYVYKGVGNGLKLPKIVWPNSDYEMGVATLKDYINSEKPFHTYYMTVSGHANYTWVGNTMATRHKNDIPKDCKYSENTKAYIACQLEVEKMLTYLVDELSAAGKLEDTVFAMCCDHFPYALSNSCLAELYGLDNANITNNFDLYRNSFIVWSASMDNPVVVDTPCASYDIAPTLYNLFGINYDSRIITGKDILSDGDHIAIINTNGTAGYWNWKTDKGTYYKSSKKFVPSEGINMTDSEIKDYVTITNQKVTAMRKYSLLILEKDYYSYIFDKKGNLKAAK